jgi:peptide/nickel transport system substrate-binding protein
MRFNLPSGSRLMLRRLVNLTAACCLALSPVGARAASPLRIAISLSDFPILWAAPDGGFEGARFGGYMVFDSLVLWDLSSANEPSRLTPGLADAWSVDPANPKRWTFHLRDAKFHDGSPWNADAAIWNLEAFTNPKAPQYNATRAGIARTRTVSIASFGKVDDHTIYIETKQPNGLLLFELSSLFFASPARFAEVGGDWQKFAQTPSGTGPYKVVSLRPGQELELAANRDYWNPKRVPKTERLVLMPVPEPNTRVAALRAGQVDLIETLPPDAIASLKGAGFKVTANVYPHIWLWRLNFSEGAPFSDIRIRKAANLAIDRDAIVDLVEKTAEPARAFAAPDSPWFGKPKFQIKYDPDAAKKLLAEAGYGPTKPVKVKVIISSSGGGQMTPLPMNEMIQENLRAVGIDVSYDVRDFTTMINMLRAGAKASDADAINIAMTMQEPASGVAPFGSSFAPPAGSNWGFYNNPAFDEAMKAAQMEFDPAKQDAAMARVNEVLTDDAASVLVVHDFNPRAMSPKVTGFAQARNWYQDYTSIEIKE